MYGKYNKQISADIVEYENIELEKSPFYYLCAVYQYKTNIHLAFYEKQGSTIKIDNEYLSIEIDNAEQIEINNKSIDYKLPQSADKNFNTCRNWWFANWINQNK